MRNPAVIGFATLCVLVAGSPRSQADGSLPHVPAGFVIERVAASPLVKHPMMAGFDERGRLFVASSAGQNLRSADLLKEQPNFIQMLEDTNGDGRFDKSQVFADKLTLPMGALWYRGALYVASPPTIWRFEDVDDDGVADKREPVVNNFGFSGNAASVHGCFLGPEGRIYWCDGRHGHEFRDERGEVTSGGLAARIFSCKPDGSDVQIYCGGGMDNPVEIDFLPTGEMLGTVNILLSKPRVDCLMHWLFGGAYPHHERAISELQTTGDLLQPMTRLGHVAVSGMTCYRSTALGPGFQNNVFTTLFNTHKVVRSVVTRSGATFRTTEQDFLVSHNPDFHPTDVLEDADGSLLVIDTGGWFRIGCPVSQEAKPDIHGAIYRIRRQGAPRIDDPRGTRQRLAQSPTEDLVNLLDDPRFAVRERAVDLLGVQGADALTPLQQVLSRTSNSETARINAVWALARMDDVSAAPAIRSALRDKAEGVRIAAVRALQSHGNLLAIDQLTTLLVSDTAAVRREAATTLGILLQPARTIAATSPQYTLLNIEARKPDKRFGRAARVLNKTAHAHPTTQASIQRTLQALFTALPSAATDRSLEHALIYAVIHIAAREPTVPFLSHSNPHVRRAALIALDQMDGGELSRDQVTRLLDTDDPELQKVTLAVISKHDGWADDTLNLLQEWIEDSRLPTEREPVLRGFLLAQAADANVQRMIGDALARPNLSLQLRLLLLEVIDRCSLERLPASWIPRLEQSLVHSNPNVRLQSIRIAQARQLEDFDPILLRSAANIEEATDIRIESIACLAPRLGSLDNGQFRFLKGQLTDDSPPLRKLAAARALANLSLDAQQLVELAEAMGGAGPMVVPVLLRAYSKCTDQSVGVALVAELNDPRVSSNLAADEVAALLGNYPEKVQKSAQTLLQQLNTAQQQQQAQLEGLSALTSGGDTQRGREVFFSKKSACASCHTVSGQGGKVGPDLTKIGAIRTARDLLEAVALPNASFARGFRPYVIVTEDGLVFTGIISRQTADTLYLRTAELSEIRVPLDKIEEMKESNTSIMPKGLEKSLSRQELQDLLAYLQTRK